MKDKIINYFKDIKENRTKKITVITFFLAPFLVNVIIEILNKRSFIKALGFMTGSFLTFVINYFIVLFTLSLVLFMKKRIVGILALSAVWIGFGIANFVLKSFRETPFSFNDIRLAGSVLDIIDKYLTPFSMVLIVVLVIFVIVVLIKLYIEVPKYAKKINIWLNMIYVAIIFLITYGAVLLGESQGWVSEKFPNMTIAYRDYGFVYCFANSVINTGVNKPEDYSADSLEEIVDKIYSEVTVDEDNVQTPNIIFLQLESFIDVNHVINLELSEEATPNFTTLKEEFPSGYLTVNNLGYGTANTEFEIMTGMNLEDFGPGEFPYNTILQSNTCESMSFILKEYGYVTHAMHNNTATFYNRHKVFKNLGYDTFTSIEYMYPETYTPLNWSTDALLADEILKVLESTDDVDYLYTISVQGHGSYPTTSVIEDPLITVSGIENEERRYQFEYYVNQIKEMDDFIGDLTNRLSDYDEDVILVLYGDHLPSLALTEKEIDNANLYQTEYIIWSNYGFDIEDKDIETFQLGSRIMQALNIDGGVINKFHQIYSEDPDYLKALKALEYDILYGDNYVFDGQSPYVPTDMQMGTYPIYISGIEKDEGQYQYEKIDNEIISADSAVDNEDGIGIDDVEEQETNSDGEVIIDENEYDNYYFVIGENFTKYSRVYINGEMYETEFIDGNKLRIYIDNLSSLDTFVVKQYYKGKILSNTNDYIYIQAETSIPE